MKDGNWSGVQGIRAQDRVVTEGMGPITPRWKEHLGTSDTAVLHFRQRMLEAVRAFVDGAEPPSLGPRFSKGQLHSDEKVVPVDWPWQSVLDGEPREPAAV
jgi:phthalate 4,5-dioxygenase oxygenase subunit